MSVQREGEQAVSETNKPLFQKNISGETAGEAFIRLLNDVDRLQEQRDGLLAACKAAVELDDRESNPDFYRICQCVEVGYRCSSCVRYEIESAIAKAEGR